MSAKQLSRTEILDLPPVISLRQLGQALGVSEPTVRAAHRSGELERMGIKVNRVGEARICVVTASLWQYLGITGASTPSGAAEREREREQAS